MRDVTTRTNDGEEPLSQTDPFYVVRADVGKLTGLHRRALIEDGPVLEFGVHGPVKTYYGLEAEPDMPLPVDYIVAAAGG
ncbi:MAG: hypothetical protein D6701_01120 [Gemmatimonadetes bacterium]|nr:MAG: hypothetical protein D6701_01120 [Gemmatimonadota bacterium]